MTNLKLPVYIFSKIFVQAIIGAVQAGLLAGVFILAVGKDVPGLFLDTFVPEVIFTIWVVIITSEATGLVISANAKSGDKAMVVAPFLLIVQLLFSGFCLSWKVLVSGFPTLRPAAGQWKAWGA